MTGVQGVARSQAARAETRENAGGGRINENRLSRVLFNNKSCRLPVASNAARARIRMASEQDEEEDDARSRCQGSGGGLGTDTV
jgi:hypothetical protein